MSSPNNTAYTTQYMDNWSFDDTYKQNAVEILAEDNQNNVLKKLQADSSGNLKVNLAVGSLSAGANGAILDGVDENIKATVKDYTNSNPLAVVTVDTNGDYVAGAGGTQYTESDTDASITGTAVMWEDRGNTLRPSSHIYPMPVDAHFDPGSIDSFGHFITGNVNNQVDIQFYRGDGSVADLITETNANGGTATSTGGMATFSATTTANSSSKGVTNTTTVYTAGAELYTLFTAGWTGTGAGTSYQRIGLYDDNNGFFIGKEANSFGVTLRKGASDTFTAKASFSEDSLTGSATSKFTRNGVPEAIDLTKLNVFRIRFGWVGSAPISFEVIAPDGHWVTFHKILQPNLTSLPSIEDADLPVTCHVNSGNSGNALTIITNCWAAGTTQPLSRMDATVTDATIAQLTRSVITGETSAGGGGYVNVKVNPSGALETNAAISSLPNEGQQTMANSISVAIASNQSAIPVTQSGTWDEIGINDSGNSITIDYNGSAISTSNPLPIQPPASGSLPVSQSGTWNITNVSGTVSLPTGASTSANQASMLTELYILNGSMAMQVDDAGSGTIYQGWADPGTATSAASWRIRKIVSSGTPEDTSITWADSNRNFDNIWNNRTSLTYA